jgi:tRNA A-37 threonylcarbamoyl transferase component Bud32
MHITIHPEYCSLTSFVERLPICFEQDGELLYEGRNRLKIMHTGHLDITVKSFKIPHIINRVAYAFFRPSKAKRSYWNALKLQDKGICTPSPIAYIEEKKKGLFSRSFYISLYVCYPGLMRELHDRSLCEVKDLAEAFAHFTADIHNRQIYHLDYSPGNILYKKQEKQYTFCLVDINRMRFDKKVDEKAAAFKLRKLWGYEEVILFIAGIYANDRGFNEDKFKNKVLRYRRKFWKK